MTKPIIFVPKITRDLACLALMTFMLGAALPPVSISAKDSDSSESSSEKSSSNDNENNPDQSESTNEEEASSESDNSESSTSIQNISSKLEDVLDGAKRNSRWGVKVEVTGTGQPLFELNANEGFIPASNRKLFTGALALDQLGPDYTFKTYLYKTGTVDANGTLNGNLVIVPSGDPTFSKSMYKVSRPDWVFKDWADKVQAAGIKYVKGDLLVDCSTWDMDDMTPKGWPARILNDSYAPQTSPLTINENVTSIFLTPAKDGQPADVSFAPPATGYPVVNKTVSGKSGGPIAKRVVNEYIEVRGGVSSKKTIWSIPIDRPTLYAAANFRHHLTENKIPIQGSVRIITAANSLPGPTPQTTLAMVQSPPLQDILSYMMKRSDNHMAEQVYVSISHARLGKGSYSGSHQLEVDLLRRAGINPNDVHCYDGCGLSEANRVAPSDICRLLSFMHTHRFAEEYYQCMAISGKDGTLRNRMDSIEGRVHAKTGTINGVKTLSGYIKLPEGKLLSFSFLVNKITGSSPAGTQDRLCRTLARLVL